MKNMLVKHGRFLAILLSGVLLVSAITFGASSLSLGSAKINTLAVNNDDKRIASELSNITSVDVEIILGIRNKGLSWNEVVEELKAKELNGDHKNIDDLLSQLETEDKFVLRLKQEGFTESEIEQAILLTDRIIFQLQQISIDADAIEYKDLLSVLNRETCIYLMLKLYKEFGSMEKVMDEYLYSLQIDLEFGLYLKDKQSFLNQKRDKEKHIIKDNFITASKIEEKMLEIINKHNKFDAGVSDNNTVFDKPLNTKPEVVLPDIPNPTIENPKVDNPLDSIMNELEIIDPLKNR